MRCGQPSAAAPSDLDASVDAFALLDQIVAARTRRSLMTVIDTLGLDPERRADYSATRACRRTSRSARDHEHGGRTVPGAQSATRPAGPGCRSSPSSCARSAELRRVGRRRRAGTRS
mgnify:CR=1 FL=1